MSTVPYFLERLGLRNDADERAIRKAYARELKQIDQEADATGFQNLRAAYEAALAWAERYKHQAEAVTAVVDSPLPDAAASSFGSMQEELPVHAPEHITPPTEANLEKENIEAAFKHFIESFLSLLPTWQERTDAKECVNLIQQSLADERLINLNAQVGFEYKLGELLASGWKPGLHILFVAAAEVFEWDSNRQRLQSLGQVGSLLDRALHERALFDSQTTLARQPQRHLIQLLRNAEKPSNDVLLLHKDLLEGMLIHFPHWLSIITDLTQVQHWRDAYAALPPRKRESATKLSKPFEASSKPAKKTWSAGGIIFFIIFLLFSALRSISNWSDDSSHTTRGNFPPLSSQSVPAPAARLTDLKRYSTPPASAVKLSKLSRKAPSKEVCTEIAKMAKEYGIGTASHYFDPGTAFVHQVLVCVKEKHWPRPTATDPAIKWATAEQQDLPYIFPN